MAPNSRSDYVYIDTNEALARFCEDLAVASYCVIDTEFIRESTYYPQLALIQIASGDHLACIDPLAITEFEPFTQLMINAELLKVFHSSSQDLEILYQNFGQLPTPVFDTQLAAAVLGYSHQISYADLVQQITGVTLEKKHTRANWMHRPLSEDEIDYALDDVRYLMAVYETLSEKLGSTRRYGWMEKDLLAMSDPANYEVDRSQLWKRLKGVQKLKGEKLQIASELAQWRETIAQQQDRPRRWILKDEAIIEIARRKSADIDSLSGIRDLSDKTISRHGDKILQTVTRAMQTDPGQWPHLDKIVSLNPQQLALGDCLMALCRVIAGQNHIALATLATRKDIDSLILNQKNSKLAQGWRFNMAGEQLLEFIHGQSSIRVDQEKLVLDSR